MVSHRGQLVAQVALAPGDVKAVHHVFPRDNFSDMCCEWSWKAGVISKKELQELLDKEKVVELQPRLV